MDLYVALYGDLHVNFYADLYVALYGHLWFDLYADLHADLHHSCSRLQKYFTCGTKLSLPPAKERSLSGTPVNASNVILEFIYVPKRSLREIVLISQIALPCASTAAKST